MTQPCCNIPAARPVWRKRRPQPRQHLRQYVAGKEWIRNSLREGEETVIAALPLYHIFALTVNLMIFCEYRFQNHPDYQPARHEGVYRRIEKEPISVFIGVNTLFNAMVNRPDFAEVDFLFVS